MLIFTFFFFLKIIINCNVEINILIGTQRKVDGGLFPRSFFYGRYFKSYYFPPAVPHTGIFL